MDHNYGTRLKDRVKEEEARARLEAKQKAANVKVVPRLRPLAYEVSDVEPSLDLIPALEVDGRQFYTTGDLVPLNKRGFKYKPCRPQPEFKANLYATTEVDPAQARFSYFDRAPAIQLDATATQCTVDEGWRLVRANVGIREGKYYFEFNIVRANRGQGQVRVGIARKEANLEAPVGFDGYSYGIRDVSGELMTLLRPQGQLVAEGFGDGDVIGFLVEFPSLKDHHEAVDRFINSIGGTNRGSQTKRRKKTQQPEGLTEFGNVVRDQVPIKYKNGLYFEQFEYTASELMNHLLNPVTVFGEKAVIEQELQLRLLANLPRIPQSKITVFKNGVAMDRPLEDVYSFLPTSVENDQVGYNAVQLQNAGYKNTDDGTLGYYPMALCFKGGVVELNLGPDFLFPVPGALPLSQRFDDQVIDEWYWDLVDEIEAEYLDSFFE